MTYMEFEELEERVNAYKLATDASGKQYKSYMRDEIKERQKLLLEQWDRMKTIYNRLARMSRNYHMIEDEDINQQLDMLDRLRSNQARISELKSMDK